MSNAQSWNTTVIYFPERNKDMYIRINHFTEGKCISVMFSKGNMLMLLVARPCSSVSRMWRGRPSWSCLHALNPYCHWKWNQGVQAPEEGLLPLPHRHAPLAVAGSRVQTVHQPWCDTIHRVNKIIHELSMPKGTELVYRVAREALPPPQCEFCPIIQYVDMSTPKSLSARRTSACKYCIAGNRSWLYSSSPIRKIILFS